MDEPWVDRPRSDVGSRPIDHEGFFHDPDALRSASSRLRTGADMLHEATAPRGTTVDAGASSEVVAAAMAMLQGLGMISTQVLRQAASGIDATSGSYGSFDNDQESAFRYYQRQWEAGE